MNIPNNFKGWLPHASWCVGWGWLACTAGAWAQGLATLAPDPTPEDCQITVTASPLEYRQFESVELLGAAITDEQAKQARPTQVICWRDVQRSGAHDVSELLRHLSTLLPEQAADLNAALHAGAVRGHAAGTLVLIDGQRLAASVLGASAGTGERLDWRLLPVSAIERIEVMTAGASSVLGSDATAGVVNIITRQARGLSVRAEVMAHTPAAGRSQRMGLSWGQGRLGRDGYRWQGHVALAQRGAGFDVASALAQPSPLTSMQSQLWLEGEAAVGAQWTVFGQFLGADESPQNWMDDGPVVRSQAWSRQSPWLGVSQEKLRQHQWRLGLKGPWQDWAVSAAASSGRANQHIQTTGLTEPTQDLAQAQPRWALPGAADNMLGQRQDSQLSTLQVLASRELVDAPTGPATWGLGWHWRQESLRAGLALPDFQPAWGQRQQWAVHSEIKTQWADAHTVTASLRHDHYSDVGDAQTGQLGWKWRPQKEWLVRAWAGTAFRAPNLAQQQPQISQAWWVSTAQDQPPVWVRRRGRADLQGEHATHWSWGFRYEPHPRWTLGADLWQAEVRRAIGYAGLPGLIASGAVQSDAQGLYLDAVATHLGRQHKQGVDYDIAWREPVSWGMVRLSVQGTLNLKSSLTNADTGARMSDLAYFSGMTEAVTPRHVWVLGASLERGPGLLMSRLRYRSGHTEASLTAGADAPLSVTTHQVPAQWRLDLGGQWAMSRQLSLSAWLKNATNRRPVTPAWRTTDQPIAMLFTPEDWGRTVQIQAEYRF